MTHVGAEQSLCGFIFLKILGRLRDFCGNP